MVTATDNEITDWMCLFLIYRNHGKEALTKDEYDRFKILTKKMGDILKNVPDV